jgi:hypothetical protein
VSKSRTRKALDYPFSGIYRQELPQIAMIQKLFAGGMKVAKGCAHER